MRGHSVVTSGRAWQLVFAFATCPCLTRTWFLLSQLFPSPTTGAIPSEPFNWMGTPENDLSGSGGVEAEQRQQYTDFAFQTAAAETSTIITGAAHTASFPQSSVLMPPSVSN